jgi:adenine deaminase
MIAVGAADTDMAAARRLVIIVENCMVAFAKVEVCDSLKLVSLRRKY